MWLSIKYIHSLHERQHSPRKSFMTPHRDSATDFAVMNCSTSPQLW
jgi:hypothetical protein